MKLTLISKILVAIAIVVLSGITNLASVEAVTQPTEREGWTSVANTSGVNILACRKGNTLAAGFKMQAFRDTIAIRKIQMKVIYNNSAHWLGKYDSWGNIRSYTYDSHVPDRHVTMMVKNRDGSNRLFTGFVYSELRRC